MAHTVYAPYSVTGAAAAGARRAAAGCSKYGAPDRMGSVKRKNRRRAVATVQRWDASAQVAGDAQLTRMCDEQEDDSEGAGLT